MIEARKEFFTVILVLILQSIITGQTYDGYTLFGPNNSRYSYLINMNNTVVKTWTHSKSGGYSAYLMKDGSVMRTATSSNSSMNGGGAQGVVQKYDWNGTLIWEYTYSTTTYRSHHDIEPLPNGNVLLIAWEVKTAAQSVQAGLNHSSTLWPDHIVEIQPVGTNGGNIVWIWHFWDHLIQDYNSTKDNYGVVANHPELLDINVGSTNGDWMHINGISYNEDLDQIVISSHNLNEIYVIDHSTTIQEAAGHTGGRWGKGGDILYRWGKPANYRATGTQVFKVVHNSSWVPQGYPGAGNILAFNNREGQGTSMVVEIVPPRDAQGNYIITPGTAYGPANPVWSYTATGFYTNHLGGNQRLPNGNTLIVESTSGYFFEVNPAGSIVWSYNRGGEIARGLRYGNDYEGLKIHSSGSVAINEFLSMNTSTSDSAGEYDPWIELYNNTDQEIYLGGRYLSDAATLLNKWRFPLNTKIAPHSYLIVWADGDVTQAGLHTNFTLSETGGKIFLSNIDKTIIDSATYFVQAGNLSMSRIPNGTGSFVQTPPTFNAENHAGTPPPPIVLIGAMDISINEFLAVNDSFPDPANEMDDWIELFNNTDSTINLSGILLTNDVSRINKWAFPEGISVNAGQYLIVWADEDTGQTGFHADFILSAEGGMILLANKDSSIIDSITFGPQSSNISFSRIPNGKGDFFYSVPTPGGENVRLISGTGGVTQSPASYNLSQNYPNPFNPATVIRYQIFEYGKVSLRIFDLLGNEVRILVNESQDPGSYQIKFDAGELSSGVYICRLQAGNFLKSIKMSLVK
ncbi:MAG: lamin tail domain-containing protein [Ignavibacteriaceae bacterium]